MRGRMMRGALRVVLAVTIAAPLTSAVPASAVVVQRVVVRDNVFKPATVTVARGTRIRWVNRGDRSHTTTSNTGLWNVTLDPGEAYARRFRKAGTFRYVCSFHSGMSGTIVVT
jgi:plastocyanin